MKPDSNRFFSKPVTRPGWWSVWLTVVFFLLNFINATFLMGRTRDVPWRTTIMPYYGGLLMVCGLIGGFLGLLAVTRERERSWMVWISILLGLLIFLFLIAEFVFPR
ncbi:hypothetical protein ACFLXB_05850 [Chloroflexota bacterium]